MEGISYLEIGAWAKLTERRPTPEEVLLIKRLDAKCRAIAQEKADKKNSKGELRVLSEVDKDDAAGLHGLMMGFKRKNGKSSKGDK